MTIKPAVIRWEFGGTKYTEATFIAPSFSEYTQQNAFTLDSDRVLRVFAPLKLKKELSADQDPFIPDNWDKTLHPLVEDIRTLINSGFAEGSCMINPILVGKGNKLHSGSHDGYEVRAFPFDFSNPK